MCLGCCLVYTSPNLKTRCVQILSIYFCFWEKQSSKAKKSKVVYVFRWRYWISIARLPRRSHLSFSGQTSIFFFCFNWQKYDNFLIFLIISGNKFLCYHFRGLCRWLGWFFFLKIFVRLLFCVWNIKMSSKFQRFFIWISEYCKKKIILNLNNFSTTSLIYDLKD